MPSSTAMASRRPSVPTPMATRTPAFSTRPPRDRLCRTPSTNTYGHSDSNGRFRHSSIPLWIFLSLSLNVRDGIRSPHSSRPVSSTPRVPTPARHISISASSTPDSRLRQRSITVDPNRASSNRMILSDMPPAARVDRTWDNGTEASLHMLVDEALGTLTYFADPYSSWQRGSNENRNGRIRRYQPKGTGFGDLAQEDLDAIVGEINDTPMKLLGYKTPNEVWDEEIAKLQSKAASPNTSVALTN